MTVKIGLLFPSIPSNKLQIIQSGVSSTCSNLLRLPVYRDSVFGCRVWFINEGPRVSPIMSHHIGSKMHGQPRLRPYLGSDVSWLENQFQDTLGAMDEIKWRCYVSQVYLRAREITFTELARRREARRLSQTPLEIRPNMMTHQWFSDS